MKNFSLPLFLNSKNKLFCLVACTIAGMGLYLLSNHFLIFAPHLLSLTSIDRAVPLIPETVWIYNSDMILFFAAYLVSKDLKNLNQYIYTFFAVLILSIGIFLVYPVTYPRDLFPMPANTDAWTKSFFNRLRSIDDPTNCLPSLHVSMSYLASFIYLGEQKRKFAFFGTWATFVALSTLTTKQHYLVDVVSGFLLAVIGYSVFHRIVRYHDAKTKAVT